MKGSMLTRKKAPKYRNGRLGSPPKVAFQDPVGHELPKSLQLFRWNVDKVERKLQEKIQEKTKIAGNFVYQQAYRLLECTRGEGIDFPSFKEQLRIKFGIILDDSELQLLFDKYDEDRNGMIDLNEFIRRVLPPDYNYGRQWFEISQQESDEKQARLKREARQEFLLGQGVPMEKIDGAIDNTGEATNWTLETLMKHIQMKVVQKTPSGDDQYRRAFKMLRSGRDQGIRMKELRNNLKTKFGIFISEQQMNELFSQFDMDGSGEIDLKEFLQFVEPPAYPKDSKVPNGIWTRGFGGDDADDDEEDGGSSVAEDNDHDKDQDKELDDPRFLHRPQLSGRKERPKSANPKKSAMLQQRRAAEQQQQQQQSVHILGQSYHNSVKDDHGPSPHPLVRPKQLQKKRQTVSMADIHSELKQTPESEAPIDQTPSQVRPRSAGSVCSSRMSMSSVGSSVSVRGAAYLKRPSTAQYLRQKCLESRIANAADDHKSNKWNKKQTPGNKQPGNNNKRPPTQRQSKADSGSDTTSIYNLDTNTIIHHHQTHQHQRVKTASPTRSVGIQSDLTYISKRMPTSRGKEKDHDEKEEDGEPSYQAPRVTKVHPKQHDNRPFSQQGKVLLRNKVHSTGCR